MSLVVERYVVWTPNSAYGEMTRPGYPGSRALTGWADDGRLAVARVPPMLKSEPTCIAALDPGERDCLRLIRSGTGDFLIIDDGPGVRACRQLGIAHANALLMARILLDTGCITNRHGRHAMDLLERCGRYSAAVISYARHCDRSALTAFYPRGGHRHD